MGAGVPIQKVTPRQNRDTRMLLCRSFLSFGPNVSRSSHTSSPFSSADEIQYQRKQLEPKRTQKTKVKAKMKLGMRHFHFMHKIVH